VLVGRDGKPIPGVRYSIKPAGGAEQSGLLDDQGRARVDELEPGTSCEVSFPELDAGAWEGQ